MRYRILLLLALLCIGLPRAQAQETIGPDTYPPGTNPLTGLAVEHPENLNRRPIMIKIDNYPPDIRPQSGLQAADMVWETLLSGGVTRFSAIFWSEDFDHIGPVRSSRLLDFELVRAYRALFTYSGMAQGTLDRLRADPLALSRAVGGSGPCPPLCRFPKDGVAFEHTLFANTAGLRDLAVKMKRDVTPEPVYGMAFEEQPPAGAPTNSITIAYNATKVDWAYDAASGRWLRSQDGKPHFDALTGTQLSADNVLVLEAEHIEQPVVSDGYWGPPNFAFTVNLTGKGRIYLFRDGEYIEGEWRRPTEQDALTYYDLQGNPLPFKPGKTFVNLVPRWRNGYELVFRLAKPLPATVAAPGGAYLRHGPGSKFAADAYAKSGDTLQAIGRDRKGEWIQLLNPAGDVVWASSSILKVDGAVMSLPFSRSTYE
jgi:hypothetical protein